jgi:hypothetical protein
MARLPKSELNWFGNLHVKYKPPAGTGVPVIKYLETEEFERVIRLIEEYDLLTSMVSVGWFGGYAMEIYEEHPDQVRNPKFLFRVHEENIPPPTRLARIGCDVPEWPERVPGRGLEHAWEVFSKYTHSDENAAKLAFYSMDPPRERSHYDY